MPKEVHLKVNWFPVQIPQSNLKLNGIINSEHGNYKSLRYVRQYPLKGESKGKWIAACIGHGDVPTEFGELEINGREIPQLTSTLISEAFLYSYKRQGFSIERSKGQSTVLRERAVENLPESLTFYEGLLIKSFYVELDQHPAFGLVIDFATHQEFTKSIAHDSIQIDLARRGYEVSTYYEDGNHISGFLKQINGDKAIVEWHGKLNTVLLHNLRLKASYHAIKDYLSRSDIVHSRNIIRLLMTESLSLTKSGFSNVDLLADRFRRVADLIGRNRSANINIPLPTVCQSLISVATAPADLELR